MLSSACRSSSICAALCWIVLAAVSKHTSTPAHQHTSTPAHQHANLAQCRLVMAVELVAFLPHRRALAFKLRAQLPELSLQ